MFLEIIVLSIFIATIFNLILNKFNMPTIIGYIITWTIIAYTFWLHELNWNEYLKMIWEFWIAFLMFTIWLEFSVKNLLKMKKNVFFYWGLQFFITSIIFFLISITLFKAQPIQSVIVSFWLSLSSTAIVLKILKENWDIKKQYWNKVIGILLFQDLMVIPILILINFLSSNNSNITFLIIQTIVSAFILFFILWFFWKYFLDKFLYIVAKTKSNEIFIWSIMFIIIWSSVLAHYLWFSYTMWAFIAWILISETHYKHQVEADLIPFRDILLWFFFFSVWMQLKIDIILNNVWLIVVLLLLFLLTKILILYLILRWSYHKKSAFKTALSLFQFWEFWIVVFEIASIKNLIDPWISQFLIVIIIISMFITPFILKNLWNLSDYLFRKKNHLNLNWDKINKEMENHIVLIWYWRLGKILSAFLEKHKLKYIIVENNIKTYKEGKKEWKPIVFWNAFQANTLKSINIQNAKTVLISLWKSENLFLVVEVVQKLNIWWNIVVKVNDFDEEKMLNKLNIKHIIVETEKTALAMLNKIKYY